MVGVSYSRLFTALILEVFSLECQRRKVKVSTVRSNNTSFLLSRFE